MDNTKKEILVAKPEPLLLRAEDAAKLCGIPKSTWYELRSAGLLPPSIKLGKARLWRLDVLKRWTQLDCPTIDKFIAMEKTCQKK